MIQEEPEENAKNEVSLQSLDVESYEDSAIKFNLKEMSVARDDFDATFNFLAPTRHNSNISCIEFEDDGI